MSTEMIMIVLLVWTIAGLLTAIVFGRMIRETDNSPNEEAPLSSSAGAIKYLRSDKRKPQAVAANDAHAAKRATG